MPDNTVLSFKDPLRTEMSVTAPRPVPLCISLCEPICARSEYEIGFEVFGNPVATITVRGLTEFYNCRDDHDRSPLTAATPQ